jgi:hypothetical protein
VYDTCQKFWDRFEKEFGSRDCYDLIGLHLDDPEENKKWAVTGGREKCTEIVRKTAEILCEYVEK